MNNGFKVMKVTWNMKPVRWYGPRPLKFYRAILVFLIFDGTTWASATTTLALEIFGNGKWECLEIDRRQREE